MSKTDTKIDTNSLIASLFTVPTSAVRKLR